MRLPFQVQVLSSLSESVVSQAPGMLYNIEDIIYRRNRINRQGETNVRNKGNLRSTA